MSRPVLLDLFCCGGGAAKGYDDGGYDVYGIDNKPQPHYPYPICIDDAIAVLQRLLAGEGLTFSDGRTLYLSDIASIHASPPCQGYSIMNNLPWIRSRTYPLLILPVRELLNQTGKPYVIENVAGARFGAKGLISRGLQEHGLKAGFLCGGMFGLAVYRHRYFETNWFWPQPGHPKHRRTRLAESTFAPRSRGVWEKDYETTHPGRSAQAAKVNTAWRAGHDGGVTTQAKPHGEASLHRNLHVSLPPGNGAQKSGVAVGHAAGWKVAAEAMGIDWMDRAHLTQAIPPVMTCYLAGYMKTAVI